MAKKSEEGRKRIKQHTVLFNPEYNYNHKVVQQKKHKMEDKRMKKEVEQFLGTKGECDVEQKEAD